MKEQKTPCPVTREDRNTQRYWEMMKTDCRDMSRNIVTSRAGKGKKGPLWSPQSGVVALVLGLRPQKLGEQISVACSHL